MDGWLDRKIDRCFIHPSQWFSHIPSFGWPSGVDEPVKKRLWTRSSLLSHLQFQIWGVTVAVIGIDVVSFVCAGRLALLVAIVANGTRQTCWEHFSLAIFPTPPWPLPASLFLDRFQRCLNSVWGFFWRVRSVSQVASNSSSGRMKTHSNPWGGRKRENSSAAKPTAEMKYPHTSAHTWFRMDGSAALNPIMFHRVATLSLSRHCVSRNVISNEGVRLCVSSCSV